MENIPFGEKNKEEDDIIDKSPKISRRSILKGAAFLGGAAALSALTGQKVESAEKENITEKIEKEAKKAAKLIEAGDQSRFFESPYLIFALYCSDRFLKKLASGAMEYDISKQVLKQFAGKISPEIRERYILMLDKMGRDIPKQEFLKTSPPLEKFAYGVGKNHPDALDLFIKEGSPIQAMKTGVVVQVERSWKKDDPFSAASLKGGNSVIIYSPADKAFYRYCHLENIFVNQGEKITAGTKIGTVGHSGLNASKPGNGGHLHFEINQYDRRQKTVRPLLEDELRLRIEKSKKS